MWRRTILALLSLTIMASAQQFKHIVILVQENRTPDNLFGWNPNFEPGVDIQTWGMSKTKRIDLQPIPLTECFDLPHSHHTFVSQYAKGAMNGFDVKPILGKDGCVPPPYPEYLYVDNSDGTIQPYFDIATGGGWANRFFQTNQGPSYPAHQFLISGTSAIADSSDVLVRENPFEGSRAAGCEAPVGSWVWTIDSTGASGKVYPCFTRDSLFNTLDAANLSWIYYSPNSQVTWNAPQSLEQYYQSPNNVLKPKQILTDIASCNLANVVWVIPSSYFSDHPGGSSTGPQWIASIMNAVFTNPTCPNGDEYWQDTAVLVTWDDWGGWFDHVVPPPTGSSCPAVYCTGFRVPLLVASAYTPPGYVSNTTLDFGSILRFVEENFSLPCLDSGEWADCTSPGLAEFFMGSKAKPRLIKSKPFPMDTDDTGDPDTD